MKEKPGLSPQRQQDHDIWIPPFPHYQVKKILVWNQLLAVNYFKSMKLYVVTERKGRQNILISPFMRKLNSLDTACPFSVQLVTYTPDLLTTKGTAQAPFTIVQIRLAQKRADVKLNKAPSFSLSRKNISTRNVGHVWVLVESHIKYYPLHLRSNIFEVYSFRSQYYMKMKKLYWTFVLH